MTVRDNPNAANISMGATFNGENRTTSETRQSMSAEKHVKSATIKAVDDRKS